LRRDGVRAVADDPEVAVPDHHQRQNAPDPNVRATLPAPSIGESPPGGPLPSLEHDLGIVEWLQCSHELSAETTGYLCDALLQWTLFGGSWPEPVAPPGGSDGNHLEQLTRLHERWLVRALGAPSRRRLELAHVGRVLGVAVRCERDPQGLAESQWREMVHLEPWVDPEPARGVLPDGRLR
jgi:hypothetical protein